MFYRVVTVALAFVLMGCGGDADRKPTFPVTGKVISYGSPLPGAAVILVPTESGKGVVARGLTGPDGVYELSTYDEFDGAVAGEYRVSITKHAPARTDAAGTQPDSHGVEVAGSSEAGTHNADSADDSASLIDPKYSDAETSGLTATVEAKANTIDFTLE